MPGCPDALLSCTHVICWFDQVMTAMSRYMSVSVVKMVLKEPDPEDMRMHHR